MMMKPMFDLVLASAVAVVIAGCGGGSAVKQDAPVQDQSTSAGGAQTGGTGGGGVSGEALGSGGTQMAMAGGRPEKLRVHFEFDSSAVDAEARSIIEQHAAYLAANPKVKIRLEGHADERGTREYNLALGERRADSVERMLRILGISTDRIALTSYGEEHPLSMGHDESSWHVNRRVEFAY